MTTTNVNRLIWPGLLFSLFILSFSMGWIAPSVAVFLLLGVLIATLFYSLIFWEKMTTLVVPEKSSGTLFDIVMENLPIGICVFDENLNLLRWNENYLDIMEIEKSQVTGPIHFRDLLAINYDKYRSAGSSKDKFIDLCLKDAQSGTTRKIDRTFKNGKIVEITFNPSPQGGFISTSTDVTSSRLSEKAMRENEDRYRRMVELSPDSIVAHQDGIILYVNNTAVKMFKAESQHDLIGTHIRPFFPFSDMERLSAYFGSAEKMTSGETLTAEKTKVIVKNGDQTDVEVEASVLMYGERQALQLIIRDISSQVQIEEFLEHAKEEAEYASQLKGTFLANMSHELRTPLNAVIGFSEVIKSQLFGEVGSPKYLEYAQDIHDSGNHLLELINDILDFSKIESGEQGINEEDIEIDMLVTECVRLTQQRAIDNDINIKLEFDPLLPQVFGDRRMLKQILINLLSNAIKFTPSGGRIITSVKIPDESGLEISVTDNGIGIKHDDIVKALTPFVQIDSEHNRKYQGTGLGLPLSKNLAEMHDGKLELQSEYGSGTIVCLTLPKSRVRQKAA
ncbi:ATP-binding protein [Sneathiella marina]|uniref:histidine kinase n=1 Tax=Sneathiella marina TaxID=2950108 RepID=A0ABY4W4C7_9PROT|nr:ATP-binding protein [Sneathiella marina]USG59516.1 ATP-binding protein [Sneathiella marina]